MACRMVMGDWSLDHHLHGRDGWVGGFASGEADVHIICTTPPLGNHSIFSILFASKLIRSLSESIKYIII